MNFGKLAIFIIVVSSYGCTNMPSLEGSDKTYASRNSAYQNTHCCITLKSMKSKDIGSSHVFSMEENNQKIVMGDTKSNYMSFRLKDSSDPIYYKLRTYNLKTEGSSPPLHSYIPTVKILDKNFNTLRSSDPSRLGKTKWSIKDDAHFWLFIKVDKSLNPNERYLLIHTDENSLGKNFQLLGNSYNQIQTYVAGGQVVTYNETKRTDDVNVTVSPSGVLVLEELGFMSKPLHESRDVHF